MNIWEIDKLLLFLLFFIPGFISIKIYELMIPSEKQVISKNLLEVISYSALNYAFLFWLIIIIGKNNFYLQHTFLFYFLTICILFIFPIIWPIIYVKIFNISFISKHIINPIPSPWDFVFMKRKSYWIIVHLKNGKLVGGKYGRDSYSSSYPMEEQIYLQEVWKLSSDGKFIKPINKSRGIIILRGEISSIEFFQ